MAEKPDVTPVPDPIDLSEKIEISDELEALIKTLKPDDNKHNIEVLEEAIEAAKIEAKKVPHRSKDWLVSFLTGKRYLLLANSADNGEDKLKFAAKAKEYLHDEKDIKQLEIISIVGQVDALMKSDHKKTSSDYIANELLIHSQKLESLGRTKEAKSVLIIQRMMSAGAVINTDTPEALARLDEAEKIAEETGFEQGVFKVRSLKYKLEAHYQPTPLKALALMRKSLEEIEKTSDKYGKADAEADIYYLQAHSSRELQEKITNFHKAAEKYFESGHLEMGHEAAARGFMLQVHLPQIPISEVLKYQRKSFEAFEKGGRKNLAHNMRGAYYGTLAIKRGLLEDKKNLFLKYSFQAIEEFQKAGNVSEFNYFLGNVALILGKDLPETERLKHLAVAADLLNKTRQGNGKFAEYQYLLTKANIEADSTTERELREKALSALEEFISSVEADIARGEKRKEVEDWLKNTQTPLLITLRSDSHRLRAYLSPTPEGKKKEYSEALTLLEELKRNNPKEILLATFNIGMLYVEIGEYDKAIKEFDEAERADTTSEQIKRARAYAQKLLEKGFRELKEERDLRNEFLAAHSLSAGQIPTHIEGFVPKVMKIIKKRGEGFERSPGTYSQKKETELRDEFLQDLNAMFPGDATSESMVGNGKTDLRIKNPLNPADEAIAECKWWQGSKGYIGAKEQLFGYVPPRQAYAFMITFTDRKDFDAVYEEAKMTTAAMADYEENSLKEFNSPFGDKKFAFISKHKTLKGGSVWIYHLLFNLWSKSSGAN